MNVPVLRFVYQYVTSGELENETLEVESTNEKDAHAKARAKLDRNGLGSIGLRLLGTEPTGKTRSETACDLACARGICATPQVHR